MLSLRWDGADAWQWLDGGAVRHGDGAAAAAFAAAQKVRVVLAAPQAWVCAQALPRLAAGRLLRAAAFALEDHLASELETVHVAVGKRRPDGLTELAVIGRADLDGLLARLHDTGLNVAAITPLAALLPADAGTVLAEPDCLTVRLGAQASLCGPPAAIAGLLQTLAPPALRWLQAPGAPPPPAGLAGEVAATPAGEALARAQADGGIDLLQGDYAPARPAGQWRAAWPAALLAGLWLAVLVAGAVSQAHRLGQQNAALRTTIDAEFRRLFPEEGRPVSLRAQAQRRLAALNQGSQGSALALLTVAARALPAQQTLSALDYQDGALTLDLSLPDVAAVETLRGALAAQPGIRVELPVAVAEGGAVRTRLILRQGDGAAIQTGRGTP